jgi:hypothetical protein
MKNVTFLMILVLGILPAAMAQGNNANAPENNQAGPAQSHGSVADPFQALLDRARASQSAWQSRDDDLDQAIAVRGVCDAGAYADVKTTLEAKRQEIADWTGYYGSHLQFQRDRAKAASSATNTRAPQRTDLVGAIQIEERELTDVNRRLSDLEQTLKEKNEMAGNQKAIESLRAMSATKQQGIDKLRRALQLFDDGGKDLSEIRGLANTRILDVQALLGGLKIETTLYENLYSGVLHRLDLKCDRATPSASKREDEDWAKRTGERIK